MVQVVGTAQLRALRQENRRFWVPCQWGWGWAVEAIVLILSVGIAVTVRGAREVITIKSRGAVASSSSEPGRQQWTWDGCSRG